ncbi:MAG: hypothetical protein ABI562_01465 [Chloroflexota bacterium]
MGFKRIVGLGVVGMGVGMAAAAAKAVSIKQTLVPTSNEAADEIVAVAIFDELDFHSTSHAFRGGRLECWYGGGRLDLRDATLAPDGATLQVRAIFGGGQILVPADWRVFSTVRGLGGIQDVRPAKGYAEDAPELVIEGLLIAAGFAVMSELGRGDAWLETRELGQDVASETQAPLAT